MTKAIPLAREEISAHALKTPPLMRSYYGHFTIIIDDMLLIKHPRQQIFHEIKGKGPGLSRVSIFISNI